MVLVNVRWQKERGPWDRQDAFNGLFGIGIPAQGVGPWNSDVIDLDAARLGETKADVIPIVREDDGWLVRGNQSEDVFICAFVDLVPFSRRCSLPSVVVMATDPLKNGQIRYYTASIEVLESTKDDVIAVIGNLLIIVPRIYRTTDEVIVLNNQLLRPIFLCVRTNNISRPAPE